jgi:hypothetical protein
MLMMVRVVVVVVGDGAKVECADVTCIKRWICEGVICCNKEEMLRVCLQLLRRVTIGCKWLVWKKTQQRRVRR